ncbi:MAG: sugar phosphate isomerase/epimerase family protein [Acidobacteriota bacterium]
MDRRTFIAGSIGMGTLAGASGEANGQAAPSTSGKKGLLLGTVTYNLARSWDIDTIIKNCKEAGFTGVELRTTHAHGVEITLSADKRQEVRRKFADSSVKLVGLGTTCEYHAADPAVVKKNIEETKAWFVLAKDVGAGGVKVRPNGLVPGVPEDKTLEQIGLALKECAAFGADYGIPLRLEIHGRETARFPRIKKIMQHAEHPNFFLCWNCNGEDLQDGGIKTNFDIVKNRLGLVHLKDLYDNYPYREFFQMLRGIDYQGYCLAEVAESSDGVRLMKYYRAAFEALLA